MPLHGAKVARWAYNFATLHLGMAIHAWVAGATGLVGRFLTQQLIDDAHFGQIAHLGRRSCGIASPKLSEILGPNMAALQTDLVPAQVAFCCLGTTMAVAGSREAFYAVDHDLCMAFAAKARAAGANKLLVVSSVGANAASANYYLRVKGETERDLALLGFDQVVVVRPSMLIGNRSENRPAEKFGQMLMGATAPLFVGPLKRYRAVRGWDMATALRKLALLPGQGLRVVENEELFSFL